MRIWYSGRGFDPPVRQRYFMAIDGEIISTAILSLPLIQVEQLPVTGERMHEVLVNCLGLSLPRKSVVRLTDRLDMTIVVETDVKQQNKNYRR